LVTPSFQVSYRHGRKHTFPERAFVEAEEVDQIRSLGASIHVFLSPFELDTYMVKLKEEKGGDKASIISLHSVNFVLASTSTHHSLV
jgi:hypothetical protein